MTDQSGCTVSLFIFATRLSEFLCERTASPTKHAANTVNRIVPTLSMAFVSGSIVAVHKVSAALTAAPAAREPIAENRVVELCHCPSASSESSSTANARTVRVPTLATRGPPSGAGPLKSSSTFVPFGRNLQGINAKYPGHVLRQMAASLTVRANGRHSGMRCNQ